MDPIALVSSLRSAALPAESPLPVASPRLGQPGATGPVAPPAPGGVEEVGAPTPENGFATTLGRMVEEVNRKQQVADQTVSSLLAGQNVPLHQAMIQVEEANLSFELMVQVRNKLLDSYQELMRMQV